MGCFGPVKPTFPKWKKSYISRMAKESSLVSHIRIKEPKFFASYEKELEPTNMPMLLQYAYARIWKTEHNAYLIKRKAKETYFFKSDPLAKVKAAVKAKKEKEQKFKEEQERIAARLRGVKKIVQEPKE